MTQRIIRVNELLKREISQQLHIMFKQESIFITITKVDTSPDLRNARIFFSVFGNKINKIHATKFLLKISRTLRKKVYQNITFKYSPKFQFIYDDFAEKELNLINEIDKL